MREIRVEFVPPTIPTARYIVLDRERSSLLPRFVHHFIAAALGFFWLPCPRCGEMFGGHEWRWPCSAQVDPVTRRAMCRKHRLVVWL